jgi:putative tryptophan/tyrosine transport system substrate-binding protein
MKRRTFISLLGGAATWPLAAQAQQAAMPVVGFLNNASAWEYAAMSAAFHQGLSESGYVEGRNVIIDYRWAEGQYDRLPAMAGELVRRQVDVIVTGGSLSAVAAKAASETVPIIFTIGGDPVQLGLVASLNRPGGNMTGVSVLSVALVAKRLELLRELVPAATRVAALVNPANTTIIESTLRDLEPAGRAMGLQIQAVRASTSREIDAAFATFVRERPDALFIDGDPFYNARRVQLVHLATLHKVPASYQSRDFPEYGGLMSYGSNLTDAYRQLGVYVGRILKGAKPAELPVVQASKFELVINAQAARIIGLTVSPQLLARADEVIE